MNCSGKGEAVPGGPGLSLSSALGFGHCHREALPVCVTLALSLCFPAAYPPPPHLIPSRRNQTSLSQDPRIVLRTRKCLSYALLLCTSLNSSRRCAGAAVDGTAVRAGRVPPTSQKEGCGRGGPSSRGPGSKRRQGRENGAVGRGLRGRFGWQGGHAGGGSWLARHGDG